MPWLAVEKEYQFDGPHGRASLLDLFEGRRQLIVYRAFFEPGVRGWPEHGCVGCSLMADQVAHVAHLNVRDTTLVYASRAPQADIQRLTQQAIAALEGFIRQYPDQWFMFRPMWPSAEPSTNVR